MVVACALVNGCAGQSKTNIQVHYVATKYYYEGIGYTSQLLHKLLLYQKDKYIDQMSIFVIYSELPNNIVDLRDGLYIVRKSSLSQRNSIIPLAFYRYIGLNKSQGNNDAFFTNNHWLFHDLFHATCSSVMYLCWVHTNTYHVMKYGISVTVSKYPTKIRMWRIIKWHQNKQIVLWSSRIY